MKAAIYNRKSTDKEDAQVLSVDNQHQVNMRAIQRASDMHVGTYTDVGSAKKPGCRKEFRRLMEDIKAGKVEKIYTWKLNRLARNPVDAGEIQWLLQEGILTAIVTPERTYLPGDNVIMIVVEFGMATQYSRDLAKDVRRGLQQKTEMGWLPAFAPIGYLNSYGTKGEKTILKDPERFDLVRRCWELLLSDECPISDIHKRAVKEWGLTRLSSKSKPPKTVALSCMYRIFSNPFYHGSFLWDGKQWPGKHEPMVTREEFERAQYIIRGKRTKPRKCKHMHSYPGLITCAECSACVVVNVVDKIVKRTGQEKRYQYYRCSHNRRLVNCTQRGTINEAAVQEHIGNEVASVDMPPVFVEWMLGELRLSSDEQQKQHDLEEKRLQDDLTNVERKFDELLDLRLEKPTLFTPETFDKKLKQLEEQKNVATERLERFRVRSRTESESLSDELNFSRHLQERFTNGAPDVRRQIVRRLSDGVQLKDEQLDFRMKKHFAVLSQGKRRLERRFGGVQPIGWPQEAKDSRFVEIISEWRCRRGSHPRMGDLQSPALLLGYGTKALESVRKDAKDQKTFYEIDTVSAEELRHMNYEVRKSHNS